MRYRTIFFGGRGTPEPIVGPILEDLDELERAVKSAGTEGPLRAIEVSLHEDDDGWEWQLACIYERPSWEHSLYESTLIAIYAPDLRREVAELGRALAAQMGVEFHFRDASDPSWIERRGPAPERALSMEWKVVWWGDDGFEHTGAGTDVVHARSLADAYESVLEAKLGASGVEAVVIECDVRHSPRGQWRWDQTLGGSVVSRKLHEALRKAIRERARPSAALRGLREREGMTPLALMVNTALAFDLGDRSLRDLSAVASWAKGDLADDRLDGDLSPRIEAHEARWNASHTMKKRLEQGERLVPILREYCAPGSSLRFGKVISLLNEVLRLSSGHRGSQALHAVWGWRSGEASDDELEAEMKPLVEEALRRWRTGEATVPYEGKSEPPVEEALHRRFAPHGNPL